jgi:hypothetical protein
MHPERIALLAAFAASLAGCESATPPGPTPPGLDPVERQALMVWAVSDPVLSLGPEAADAVQRLAPNGILAAGDAAPWLAPDPADENPSALAVMTWTEDTAAATGVPLALAVEAPLLPGDVVEACFDPADPDADPSLAALREGLAALLDAWPSIGALMPDPTRDTAYWDVSCTCTPCDGVDPTGMAARHEVLWEVALDELALRQREAWWWHRAPDSALQGAPVDTPTLPRSSLDRVLGGVPVQTSLRAQAGRGLGGPWAPPDPVLSQSASRRVAGSLDASGGRYGATDALLLAPLDLYAQLREERSRGVGAWFVRVDGGGRTALGTLEELDLLVIERAFRDPSSDPSAVLLAAVMERYGLSDEDAYPFANALRDTGHALALATHPLGVPIAGIAQGTPGTLPLVYGDPSAFDSAWAPRSQGVAEPGLAEIVQANQWATEAALTTSVAIGELNAVQDQLLPQDEAELRRRLETLDYAARAWGRLALADITWRAVLGGLADGRAAGWLNEDADQLDSLAAEVDAALDSGAILEAFPVVPANLRDVAAQLRSEAGSAPAQARDFPVIYRQRHDFQDGRVNYYWTVNPPGIGWVERGPAFPVYDETSDRGEEDATWWHAWTNGVPADSKVVWRACTETPEGLVACGSDRVLWTPL